MLLTVIFLAIGTWFGSIVFQSALVAPVVFRVLDADGARRMLRTLFPRFFILGLACGFIALISLVFPASLDTSRNVLMGIIAVMLAANLLALALVPTINSASDDGDTTRFRRLHGASVALTLGVLAGCIAVVSILVGTLPSVDA